MHLQYDGPLNLTFFLRKKEILSLFFHSSSVQGFFLAVINKPIESYNNF